MSEPGTAILCFAGQDWWYHNRAHSDFQLMLRAAKERDVLLVNSLGMRMPTPGKSTLPARRIARKLRSMSRLLRRPVPELPRFHVFTPIFLPVYGDSAPARANASFVAAQVRLTMRWLGIHDPVALVTLPTAWPVIQQIPHHRLLFNRSDKHSEFGEVDRGAIEELERELLTKSDVVLYVSHELMREERPLTGERARFLDHGVDLEHFSRRADEPEDLRAIGRPRIGFFGGFDDYVIDFDLLERIAVEIPDAELVLIGDATCSMKRFESHANVHWLGFRPYEQIPRYGSGFDVAIMPWLKNDWIRRCNPIKMKEYLALGLPIVSTDFPEVHHYRDVIRVGTDADEFIRLVRESLADAGPASPALRRQRVEQSSWDAIAREFLSACESPTAGGAVASTLSPAQHPSGATDRRKR